MTDWVTWALAAEVGLFGIFVAWLLHTTGWCGEDD